ncbi:MAG: DUF1571 domain-containing protein [Pirellulales bacterium]
MSLPRPLLIAILFALETCLATASARSEDAVAGHPLVDVVESGKVRISNIEKRIQDYSCKLTKRERVGGELLGHEIIYCRVRHNPYSVYLYFLAPEERKGQQAVYVEGQNDDKLLALPVGVAGRLGVYTLKPDGFLAMQGQRYPITETGFLNLARRLIEVGEKETTNPNTKVRIYKNAKVDGRPCTVTEVVNAERGSGDIPYHKARIFVDDELDIPVRFESYDWPAEEGGEPLLLEEYTYTDIKLNPNFKDSDFEIRQ